MKDELWKSFESWFKLKYGRDVYNPYDWHQYACYLNGHPNIYNDLSSLQR